MISTETSLMYRSLPDLLFQQSLRYPAKPFLFSKSEGHYQSFTFSEVFTQIKQVGTAFLAHGVQKGDRIAILSGNRPEWVFSDLGIMGIGAVCVSIYPTLSATEIAFLIQNSGTSWIVVETPQHLQLVLSIWENCPCLNGVVALTSFQETILPLSRKDQIFYWPSFLKTADAKHSSLSDLWDTRFGNLQIDELATIVYTSGTTGLPKGAMLSHRNFLSNVRDIVDVTPVNHTDSVLSFLPLSHVFERTVGYYTLLWVAGAIYYAESMQTVAADLVEVKPTVLVSVPRLYEKIYAKILDQLSGVKKLLFNWAFKLGYQAYDFPENSGHSYLFRLKLKLADRLVFSKIRAKTGGCLRFFVSGGAPLSPFLARFFKTAGLLIIEGYGMTETGPVIACNRLDAYKFGTVGQALPSVQTRLAEDGELLVKGPSIMLGYWNNFVETQAVINSEGWLHTGDIATLDSDGFITIVDRKKELIVLSNGKKIAPQLIEKRLLEDPLITQAVVIGENRNYLSALIVPNVALFKTVYKSPLFNAENWNESPEIIAFLLQRALKTCVDLAPFEQIKHLVILTKELTQESGELTPTLKPKRKVIEEKYARQIELMYH